MITSILPEDMTAEEQEKYISNQEKIWERIAQTQEKMRGLFYETAQKAMAAKQLSALVELVQKKEYDNYITTPLDDFRYMVDIAMREEQLGFEAGIYKLGTVDKCARFYQQLVFYLRRIEVDMPEEIQEESWRFMMDNMDILNPAFMNKMILSRSIVFKFKTLLQVADYFKEHGMPDYAKSLYLEYCFWIDFREVDTVEIASRLLELQYIQEAYAVLQRIEEPSEPTVLIMDKLKGYCGL